MFPILCRIFEQMHPDWSIRSWSRGPRNAEQPMMRRSGKATEQSLHLCWTGAPPILVHMASIWYGWTHEWTTPNRSLGLVLARGTEKKVPKGNHERIRVSGSDIQHTSDATKMHFVRTQFPRVHVPISRRTFCHTTSLIQLSVRKQSIWRNA
jgi:hypothetical protein